MVKLNKSPLPYGVTITKPDDYRADPVFGIIKNDCHNKCYICEDKKPSSINVEHRIAHKGDPALQFCWKNLMFSCSHCNDAKNQYYNNILDCTVIDPEEYIALSIQPFPTENISIDMLNETDEATETLALLERVYNSTAPTILALECENLKSKIFDEIISFNKKLDSYSKVSDPIRKQDYKNAIISMIDRSSAFAAFKRKIVRDNPTYMKEFGKFLA